MRTWRRRWNVLAAGQRRRTPPRQLAAASGDLGRKRHPSRRRPRHRRPRHRRPRHRQQRQTSCAPKSTSSVDQYVFIGAAIFEFVFILALVYGAYYIRKSKKELIAEELRLEGKVKKDDQSGAAKGDASSFDNRKAGSAISDRQDTKTNVEADGLVPSRNAKVQQSKQSSVFDFDP